MHKRDREAADLFRARNEAKALKLADHERQVGVGRGTAHDALMPKPDPHLFATVRYAATVIPAPCSRRAGRTIISTR
jgi:hypothetical protein